MEGAAVDVRIDSGHLFVDLSARAAWCSATPGYLVARGYYTRHILAMMVALFVAGGYGLTILFGLIPLYPGVSWQSHLGGALGSILAARAAARSARLS